MNLTMDAFIRNFSSLLSHLVQDERTVLLQPRGGNGSMGSASVFVTFINLPHARVQEKRGGGAEAENNRMLFSVWGFNGDPRGDVPVEKVQVEQLVNNVGKGVGRSGCPNLKKKTASPDKISAYLATYLNKAAAENQPEFTHE